MTLKNIHASILAGSLHLRTMVRCAANALDLSCWVILLNTMA